MGERLPYKQDVIGSSPIVSTTKPRITFFVTQTSVIYFIVNSLVLTFKSSQSATLLLGLDPKAQGALVCVPHKPDELI